MGVEIEHKYKVVNDSYKKLSQQQFEIAQGYLCRAKERTVRIRIRDEKGFITVKGVTNVDSRSEFEYEIPLSDAAEMLDMCEPVIIRKTRYIVPFKGNVWEVDEFHGEHEGLTVAEIEIPSSDYEYEIPDFVGENVTNDVRYYNSTLSQPKE